MTKVFSSHINSVGYDKDAQALHVTYASGKTAVYGGVPPDVASQVTNAPSIGQAIHKLIRGQFEHKYGA
jgi:hypothetical protein